MLNTGTSEEEEEEKEGGSPLVAFGLVDRDLGGTAGLVWSGLVWLRQCRPVLTCQMTKFNLISAPTEAWATSPLCFCFFSSKLSDGVKFTEKIPPPELLWTILPSHYIKTLGTHCFSM